MQTFFLPIYGNNMRAFTTLITLCVVQIVCAGCRLTGVSTTKSSRLQAQINLFKILKSVVWADFQQKVSYACVELN